MPHDTVDDGYAIKFTAYFDDKKTEVSITYNKYGGGLWYVYLDSYYQGRVWHTGNFGWQHDINGTSPLSFDDILTINGLITEQVGPPTED